MMVLYKNAVLIFWLTNLLPETRTWSTNIFIEIFYCVYEFFIPIMVSLFFCILSSIILKQKGFKDKNGNIIKNKEGEEANLWDILEKDSKGQLKVRSDVANFGSKEMGMFSAKVSGMIKRTNQLKGSFDKTLIERQGAFSLVALFRKFMNPAYRKRFGHRSGGYQAARDDGTTTPSSLHASSASGLNASLISELMLALVPVIEKLIDSRLPNGPKQDAGPPATKANRDENQPPKGRWRARSRGRDGATTPNVSKGAGNGKGAAQTTLHGQT